MYRIRGDVVSYGQLLGCTIIIIFKVSLIDGRGCNNIPPSDDSCVTVTTIALIGRFIKFICNPGPIIQ